jgi:hypothetical protein
MNQLYWIVKAAFLGFLIPFLFGNSNFIPVDVYYLIYFISVGALYFFYFKQTGVDMKKMFSKNIAMGIVLGLIFAGIMAKNVFSRPETDHLTGLMLTWALVWRGLIYGAVDGLFLTTFPWIVTWGAFNVRERPLVKKIGFTLLAWVFTLVITTAYHTGYKDFRSKKLIQPNIGNSIMSLPTFLSMNPMAAPITHAGMHMSAVIHSPETDLFLPPHR